MKRLGPRRAMFKQLGKQLIDAYRDQKTGLFLAQGISIATLNGNAAGPLGTLLVDYDAEEFFDTRMHTLLLFF